MPFYYTNEKLLTFFALKVKVYLGHDWKIFEKVMVFGLCYKHNYNIYCKNTYIL